MIIIVIMMMMMYVWAPDDVWDSHPKYPREEWIHEVMSKNTNLGYWDWVNHQIEIDTYDD